MVTGVTGEGPHTPSSRRRTSSIGLGPLLSRQRRSHEDARRQQAMDSPRAASEMERDERNEPAEQTHHDPHPRLHILVMRDHAEEGRTARIHQGADE